VTVTITPEALREVALTQAEYDQIVELLGRAPTAVELGMFGAMWSEHCGYKISLGVRGGTPGEPPHHRVTGGQHHARHVRLAPRTQPHHVAGQRRDREPQLAHGSAGADR
jgi:phosphoribosylformylglycinamidine (FGAM) synthase-like enzyme